MHCKLSFQLHNLQALPGVHSVQVYPNLLLSIIRQFKVAFLFFVSAHEVRQRAYFRHAKSVLTYWDLPPVCVNSPPPVTNSKQSSICSHKTEKLFQTALWEVNYIEDIQLSYDRCKDIYVYSILQHECWWIYYPWLSNVRMMWLYQGFSPWFQAGNLNFCLCPILWVLKGLRHHAMFSLIMLIRHWMTFYLPRQRSR